MKVYTAQRDAHGNWIVCRGTEPRRGYQIIYTGSYDDCQMYKFGIRVPAAGVPFCPAR